MKSVARVLVVVALLVAVVALFMAIYQADHGYRWALSVGMTGEGAKEFAGEVKAGRAHSPFEYARDHRWVIDPAQFSSELSCLERSGIWER